jgi:hypothetical protein
MTRYPKAPSTRAARWFIFKTKFHFGKTFGSGKCFIVYGNLEYVMDIRDIFCSIGTFFRCRFASCNMKILANLTSTHHPTKLPSGGIRSHDQTIW